MFKDIWSDIFSPYQSFGDRCLAALMALFMLAVVGLLGLLAFLCIDSVGVNPTKTAVATVEVKQVVPVYSATIIVGKVIVPQYRRKSYRLHFKIDEEDVSFTVDKNLFDEVNVGSRIEVYYGFRRLSNSHQPTRIKLVSR